MKRNPARTPPALPLPQIAARLVAWYEAGHRLLPWRETVDPYEIWVSEIMLQQTRVETVIPYYRAFLRRFPDVGSLAASTEEQLLKAWEGLGYYRRARNLRAAARILAASRSWPSTAEELAALPGIGRSTAGAIASIAFGLPSPILDGNVRRVWCRLATQKAPPPSSLWALSEAVLRYGPPGTLNQALMELGATVCTPKGPACAECPLGGLCEAFASGEPAAYPSPPPRKKMPLYDVSVAFLWMEGRFFITRRPEEALLGGLWELPGGKWEEGEEGQDALVREMREELGTTVSVLRAYPPVRHAYSHFAVRLHPFDCEPAGGRLPRTSLDARWIVPGQISDFAFPRGTQKIFASVFGNRRLERAAEPAGSYGTEPGEP